MCFIYFLEGNVEFGPVLLPIFKGFEDGRFVGISSSLALTEILIHPQYQKSPVLFRARQKLLTQLPNFSFIAPVNEICFEAARLGARYNLKPIDAIHLATVSCEKVNVFLTNDERLKVVKKPKVVLLTELEI